MQYLVNGLNVAKLGVESYKVKDIKKAISLTNVHVYFPFYLHDAHLDSSHVCLPGRVLLHVPSGRLHCEQDARIRHYNHGGGEDVAEDEERQRVRAGHSVLVGHAPVNAAGGAIRFWSIFSPMDQRGTGK